MSSPSGLGWPSCGQPGTPGWDLAEHPWAQAKLSLLLHFLLGWGHQMRSPECTGRVLCVRPSRFFHPAIKPEVKYLLNDAIRPEPHYSIYLAIK